MNELDYNAEEVSVGFKLVLEFLIMIYLLASSSLQSAEATDKEINQSIENMQKDFDKMPDKN